MTVEIKETELLSCVCNADVGKMAESLQEKLDPKNFVVIFPPDITEEQRNSANVLDISRDGDGYSARVYYETPGAGFTIAWWKARDNLI